MSHSSSPSAASAARPSLVDDLRQDLAFAARTLLRNPSFAIVAVVTLGLGIGANTALFSLIDGVLLKPLPYTEGDRLVVLKQSAPLAGQSDAFLSIKEYYDYRSSARVFDGLVEYHQMSFDLIERGEPDRVDTGVVSHDFFDVLGIRPLLGRTFTAADDRPGAEAVLVLSHAYWQSRFGGDPGVVGQVFRMNDRPHRVVGVLPNVPHYPRENDVYMPVLACPFRAAAEQRIEQNRRAFAALVVFGRLEATSTHGAAATEVATICHRFTQAHPQVYRPDLGFQATSVDVREELTREARPMLVLLMSIAALVLVLACANVANLTMARLLRRDREMALRVALGAGRGRLVRQLLAESALLGLAGGAVGMLVAYLTLDVLTVFIGRFTTRVTDIRLDATVMGFTVCVSVLAGLLFGVAPAWLTPLEPGEALKQGGKGTFSGRARGGLPGALVVAQVSVSVVLLVAAGLLLTSLGRLQRVDGGYRPEHVLSAEVFGNFTKYPDVEALINFYQPLVERLEAQPGVRSAAITNAVPLSGIQPGNVPFQIEGQAVDAERRPTTDLRIVSARYFETLGIPVIGGRVFRESDRRDAPLVVVINRAMTKYWDRGDPIGARLSLDGGTTWATVVGVVGDVRQFGLDRDAQAQVYTPLRQAPFGLGGRILVRTAGDPSSAARLVRDAVRTLDANMPIENVRTLEDLRARYLATPRLTALLLGLFAGLALLVTLTGVTGVIATSVSQRTREFGIRMALGASRQGVLALVLGQGLRLVGIGLALGLGGAALFTRLLSTYLYDTTPLDPLTLGLVVLLCLAAGAAACLGPAWRAVRVDPMRVLGQ